MGANVQNNRRGGGRSKRNSTMAEINVTPFVDVMLVLLVIFMVAAPLSTSGIEVNLPKAENSTIKMSSKPLTVSIKKDGTIYIAEDKILPRNLGIEILRRTNKNTEEQIYVRADKLLDYGAVMRVISTIKDTGYTKIGLITESEV